MKAPLAADALTLRAGRRTLCRDLSLGFAAGSCWAILGPNGAGKSTLLTALAGLRTPESGRVLLDGEPVETLSRRAIALRLGLLPQDSQDPFPASVLELALAGRYPHLPLWGRESLQDIELARHALRTVGLEELAERSVATLSGGERRRLGIATLLCQDPAVLLLDEPANHLDLQRQVTVLSTLRDLAREGHTVLAVLHDPTLAARFCDRALLLFGDGRWQAGESRELLTAEPLSELYGYPLVELAGPNGPAFVPA